MDDFEVTLDRVGQELTSRWSHVFVDATHAEVTRDVLRWMAEHRLFGALDGKLRDYQKQAIVAATFGCRCAPTGASPAARLHAAKFTALFLYLDDTTNRDVMSSERWRNFHTTLIALLRGDAVGESHAALAEWLRELREVGRGAALALHDFEASFLDYCLSLNEERCADFATMGAEEFLKLRRRTIFVQPFLDHWRVSAAIDVSGDDPGRSQLVAAQAMACDLIIWANDLGSLARDMGYETTEMSVVLLYARELGVERGAERAIDEYNALLCDFRRLIDRDAATEPSWFASLADLLGGVVDGNLDTMLALEQRYSESSTWLHRLLRARR